MTKPLYDNKAFLTTQGVADRLCVSLRSIQIWCADGILPVSRTPLGHRRLHVAHVDLLAARMRAAERMPATDEYLDAERLYTADPAGWHAARQPGALPPPAAPAAPVTPPLEAKLTELRGDPAGRMTLFQAMRYSRGEAPLAFDENGHMRHTADVERYAMFCAGIEAVLSFALNAKP